MLFISFKLSRRVEASRGISGTECIIVKIILKKFEPPLAGIFHVVLITRFSIYDTSESFDECGVKNLIEFAQFRYGGQKSRNQKISFFSQTTSEKGHAL